MSSLPEPPPDPAPYPVDQVDFAELFRRARAGMAATIGLALLGFALAVLLVVVVTYKRQVMSSLHVTFGFPGFERGTYPNGSKFQPDDLRAPDVVNEAVKRLGIQGLSADAVTRIRGAIGVSGFVSSNIIKERDRLRATGQVLPPYVADEFEVSLSLPRSFPVDNRQRELLLAEIINVYLEKFRRTYVQLPPEFGNTFAALRDADFVEYELILTKELESLKAYLEQRIDADKAVDTKDTALRVQVAAMKQFRSPTNNLSFRDLLKLTELFTQVRLNDVLSQIYVYGLSKDRRHAMVKMDYYLRTLMDQERLLREEEAVVSELLRQTQERSQNYVLATRAQNPPGNQPMLDQGFIDTLLANDAYNFLVRRALDAGMAVKRVQTDKARLQERRERMEAFAREQHADQADAITRVQSSLAGLEASYQELLSKVRVVLDDYARQEYADAIRITKQARTESIWPTLLLAGVAGLCVGAAVGLGFSMLGIRIASRRA